MWFWQGLHICQIIQNKVYFIPLFDIIVYLLYKLVAIMSFSFIKGYWMCAYFSLLSVRLLFFNCVPIFLHSDVLRLYICIPLDCCNPGLINCPSGSSVIKFYNFLYCLELILIICKMDGNISALHQVTLDQSDIVSLYLLMKLYKLDSHDNYFGEFVDNDCS